MDALGRQELEAPLQDLEWCFAFDRAKRRLGSCQWHGRGKHGKLITVSRYHATRADQAHLIEDVLRHEIAHAIDFEQRGRSDHGPRWKAICRRVGADPSRLYEAPEGTLLPGKYTARCPGCRCETQYYRMPTRARACRRCCRAHSGGRYDARFRLEVTRNY